MSIANEVVDYLLNVLELAETPYNNLIQSEMNRIYIRLPAPQLHLLGILGEKFSISLIFNFSI